MHTRPDSGFVLFVVLVAVLALASLAVLITRRTHADIKGMAVEMAVTRAELASQAGLARAIASFEGGADRLGLTPYTGEVLWRFGDIRIRMRMEAESGKLDILRADLELIRSVVARLVPDPFDRQQVLERISQLRARNVVPYDLEAILPPKLRVSNLANAFEPHFTVVVSQSGVDPIGSSPLVREAVLAAHPNLRDAMSQSLKWRQVTPELASGLAEQYSLPTSLFTMDIQASLPSGVSARRRALVSLDFSAHRVYVLRETRPAPEPSQ